MQLTLNLTMLVTSFVHLSNGFQATTKEEEAQ